MTAILEYGFDLNLSGATRKDLFHFGCHKDAEITVLLSFNILKLSNAVIVFVNASIDIVANSARILFKQSMTVG